MVIYMDKTDNGCQLSELRRQARGKNEPFCRIFGHVRIKWKQKAPRRRTNGRHKQLNLQHLYILKV